MPTQPVRVAGLILAVVAGLAAEDSFRVRAAPHRAPGLRQSPDGFLVTPTRPPWHLWLPTEAAALALKPEPWLSQLTLTGQLKVLACPVETLRSLAPGAAGDGRPGWMLLSGLGEPVAQGPGPVSGEAVMAAFRAQGWPPLWEVWEARLREHPEDGPTCLRLARLAYHLASQRLNRLQQEGQVVPGQGWGRPKPRFLEADPGRRADLADAVFGDAAAALARVFAVPGWAWSGRRLPPLAVTPAADAPRIRAVAKAALQDLEAAYRQDPGQPMAPLWSSLVQLAGEPASRLPEGVRPVPGQVWPPVALVRSGALEFGYTGGDWEAVLALASAAEAAFQPSRGADAQARLFRATVAATRYRALLQLGRSDDAVAALRACRAEGREAWLEVRGSLGPGIQDANLPKDLAALLKAPDPPPAPRPPAPQPLRLCGGPELMALRGQAAFLPWAPEDLAWVPSAQPGWSLVRGEARLAQGAAVPAPATLADLLTQRGRPRLAELNALIEAQPGHLGARRARLALLKARMPEPRLEPLLAEDAQAVVCGLPGGEPPFPLDFGPGAPWHPDPGLWQHAALEVLPKLEARLRCWPDSGAAWQAWVAWSRFHPRRPTPAPLFQSLVDPGDRAEVLVALGPPVHQAIAEALLQDGEAQAAVDWLTPAWAAEQADGTSDGALARMGAAWVSDWAETVRKALVAPLRRALQQLGRIREAEAVTQAHDRWTRTAMAEAVASSAVAR